MNPLDLLYNVAREHLGERLTLNPNVDPSEGCAEAVSTILRACGYPIPATGIPSVLGLISWLLANGFQEISYPVAGAVITAHNADLAVTDYSHTGICLKYGIGSNNSFTNIMGLIGRFTENYSYDSWTHYFETIGGSTTRYFIPVDNATCTPTPNPSP